MTGFEQQTFGFESAHSTNWATTTALSSNKVAHFVRCHFKEI